MGHLGVDRVLTLIWDHFYWLHMQKDIEHYVKKECSCLKNKCPNKATRAPLTNITTTYPFELVSIDFLHLEKCKGGIGKYLFCDGPFYAVCPGLPLQRQKCQNSRRENLWKFCLEILFSLPAPPQSRQGVQIHIICQTKGIQWNKRVQDHTIPPPGKWSGETI